MALKDDDTISAQVLLNPASGPAPDPSVPITSENINKWLPSPESVTAVTAAFRSLGFEVGPMLGISFAITGAVRVFRKVFKARIRRTYEGGIACGGEVGAAGLELPLENLPSDVVASIQTVTFVPPPDFGPTDF